MSDFGRKGLGEQTKEKVTPDSQKSVLDQAKEGATGAYDRAASALQPEENKSATQKAGDTFRSGSDNASDNTKGFVAQAQDTLNSASQAISDTFNQKK